MNPKKTVGLVGIGLVGTAIAENLLASGFVVVGFARREVKRREFERLGGQPVESLDEVARSTSRVILSLTDSDAVEEVVLGPGGLLGAVSALRVIIDTTTGEPDRTESSHGDCRTAASGFSMRPSPAPANRSESVRASVLIGGERTAYESCLDLIQILSQKHYYLGGPGAGSRAKLASNLILGLNRLVLAEGLVFAERLGLDPDTFPRDGQDNTRLLSRHGCKRREDAARRFHAPIQDHAASQGSPNHPRVCRPIGTGVAANPAA